MRKILVCVAMSVSVAVGGVFAAPQAFADTLTAVNPPVTATVSAADGTNVWDAPASTANVLGTLAAGDTVQVTGVAQDGWLQITTPQFSEAYVPQTALSVPDGSLPATETPMPTPTPTPTTVAVTGVSVSPRTVSVPNGTTTKLTATVSPANATDKTVSWASSNTAVASVSSAGVVKGAGLGKATITAMTTDGGLTASVTVTVTRVAVKGVSVTPSKAVVKAGKTITLKAKISPSNATNTSVSWSSANKKIATVSSAGKVTAKKSGTVKITVKTADGAKKATVSVKVSKSASTLKMSGGVKVPALMKPGTNLSVKGTVKSNYTITALTATLKSWSGAVVSSASVAPYATSYDMKKLASKFVFSDLKVYNQYTYTVVATDAAGKKKTVQSATLWVTNGKATNGRESTATAKKYDDQFPVSYTSSKGSIDAFIQIAESQVGYHEGAYDAKNKNVVFPGERNWSKYGIYVGWPTSMHSPNGASREYAWCAAFVTWVAYENGTVGTTVPNYINTTAGWKWYKSKGRFHKASGYTPKPGDTVFYGPNGNLHTGIVVSVGSGGAFTTVEGNHNDAVRVANRNVKSHDYVVFGFGSNS